MALGLTHFHYILYNRVHLLRRQFIFPPFFSISFSKINLDTDYCLKITLLKIPEAQTFHCKILFTKDFWHSERIRDSNFNFMTPKLEATLKFLSLEGTSKCHHKFSSYAAGTSDLSSVSIFWQGENPLRKHHNLLFTSGISN